MITLREYAAAMMVLGCIWAASWASMWFENKQLRRKLQSKELNNVVVIDK